MGAIQLSDEFLRVIDQQVAQGRASTGAAFLEEAVRRLLDDARLEDEEIGRAAASGIADIEARRFIAVTTVDGTQLLHQRLMARVADGLAHGG